MGWQIIKPTRFSIARKGKQCCFVRLSSPGAVCAVASGCTGNKWFHQAAIVWGRSVCTQHSQQLVYLLYLFIYLHLQPNIHSVERHQYRRNTTPEFVGQTIVQVSQLPSWSLQRIIWNPMLGSSLVLESREVWLNVNDWFKCTNQRNHKGGSWCSRELSKN